MEIKIERDHVIDRLCSSTTYTAEVKQNHCHLTPASHLDGLPIWPLVPCGSQGSRH